MSEIDSLTREKIREWQIRRLGIKEQMQLHPSRALEFSRVLDLMDEEHAEILSGSNRDQYRDANRQENNSSLAVAVESFLPSASRKLDLQLHLSAKSPAGLCRLLEMAVLELKYCIDRTEVEPSSECSKCPGGMSGTLGSYEFVLDIKGEDDNE